MADSIIARAHRVARIVVCALSLCMLTPAETRAKDPDMARHVLLLSQAGVGGPIRAHLDAAFVEALRNPDAGPIDPYQESIDTERFPGGEQSRLMSEYLVVGGAVIFLAQLALIVGLFAQRGRRRRVEARNRAILRALPDLMFVLRLDGTYVDYHARDRHLLFTPPDQFIGRTIRQVLPAELATMFMDAIARTQQTADPVLVEYELPIDGSRQFEARLVNAGNGHVLSIVRDVTESKRALERNRDLAGRLIASQEMERGRIARDLHDDACQEIASVALLMSHCLHTTEADRTDIRGILVTLQSRIIGIGESLRRLSHDLHPAVLQHIGLVAALEAHCAEIGRQHNLQVTFRTTGDFSRPDERVSLSLFRIAQEALRNAAKHGGARQATVFLAGGDRELRLIIADDGCGFDPGAARRTGGLGLVSMEERARLVNGEVTIRSTSQEGTAIEVRVPLHDHAGEPLTRAGALRVDRASGVNSHESGAHPAR